MFPYYYDILYIVKISFISRVSQEVSQHIIFLVQNKTINAISASPAQCYKSCWPQQIYLALLNFISLLQQTWQGIMKCDSEKVMSFIDNDFSSCEGKNLPQMKRKNVSFTKALNLIITRVLDNTKEKLTRFRIDGSNTSAVWSKNILSFISLQYIFYRTYINSSVSDFE